MASEDHEPLVEELESQADRLEQQGREVQDRIDETRQEWERKRADDGVPGANPPPRQSPPGEESPSPGTGQGGPAGVGEPGSSGEDPAGRS